MSLGGKFVASSLEEGSLLHPMHNTGIELEQN